MPLKEKDKRRSLTAEELKVIRDKLLLKKEELWREILEDIEEDVGEEHQDLVQVVRDQGDDALAELRESTVFTLIEMKHKELQSIEQALIRIDKGGYGRCKSCGGWIRPARLEVMPHAVRCRACQQKLEK
jgi:DnaK suppressor protein